MRTLNSEFFTGECAISLHTAQNMCGEYEDIGWGDGRDGRDGWDGWDGRDDWDERDDRDDRMIQEAWDELG